MESAATLRLLSLLASRATPQEVVLAAPSALYQRIHPSDKCEKDAGEFPQPSVQHEQQDTSADTQMKKRRQGIGSTDNTLDGLVAKRAADGERACIGNGKRYRSELEAIELPDDEAVIKADPDISTRQCSICGYQGKWVSEIIRHKRVHTQQNPFKCKYCNRTSKWKADLIRHVAKTHGIRVVSKYSRSKSFEASITIDTPTCEVSRDSEKPTSLHSSIYSTTAHSKPDSLITFAAPNNNTAIRKLVKWPTVDSTSLSSTSPSFAAENSSPHINAKRPYHPVPAPAFQQHFPLHPPPLLPSSSLPPPPHSFLHQTHPLLPSSSLSTSTSSSHSTLVPASFDSAPGPAAYATLLAEVLLRHQQQQLMARLESR